MLEINKDKLKNYTRVEIINLMNSITGAKPALLLGTKSISKVSNLAIFSSIVHISSSPALFAFLLETRKTTEGIPLIIYLKLNVIHLIISIQK